MSGERMTKIYVQVCLGQKPKLETEEEKQFYKELVAEMREAKKNNNDSVGWEIPSE